MVTIVYQIINYFPVAVRRRRSASVEESKKKEKKDKEKERKRSRSRSKDRRDKDRDRSRYDNWPFYCSDFNIFKCSVFIRASFRDTGRDSRRDGGRSNERVNRRDDRRVDDRRFVVFAITCFASMLSFLIYNFADAVPVLAVQKEGEMTGTEIEKEEGMFLSNILVELVFKIEIYLILF